MDLRFAFVLAIALGGALLGRACAGAGLRRVALLNGLRDALALLRVQTLEGGKPLREALSGAPCPVFAAVGEEMADASAVEAWRRVRARELHRGGLLDSLREVELAALDALFTGLGQSGRAEQAVLMENVRRALEDVGREAGAACAGKERLYTTLGLLAGLALALCAL